MNRHAETDYEKRIKWNEKLEKLAKALQVSAAMHMKFKLIPPLIKKNKAFFRDFFRGKTESNALPIATGVFTAVSFITWAVSLKNTIQSEFGIDDEIEALRMIVGCLTEDLESAPNNPNEVRGALVVAKEFLKDSRECKKNPGKRSILSLIRCGAEWAGAAGGAIAGAKGGAAIGSAAGPTGAASGALLGGFIGALSGTALGSSAVENAKHDENTFFSTVIHSNVVDLSGEGVKAKVAPIRGNVYVGKEGWTIGAEAAAFERKEEKGNTVSVAKVGANCGFTSEGVDVGIEGKAVWMESEGQNVKIGAGISVDTGFKANQNGVDVSLLGFGFKNGKDGFGIKLPIFNVFFKH